MHHLPFEIGLCLTRFTVLDILISKGGERMNQTLTFDGFCPEQNKEYTVSVNYINSSTLTENKLIRGLAKCDYASSRGCSYIDNCPILKLAPKEI